MIPASLWIDFWSASKIAEDADHGPFEQAAAGEIVNEAAGCGIKLWQESAFQPAEVVGVGVPCCVGVRRPGDGDQAGARFDQPLLTLYRASLPFLAILLACLLVITYVPALSLFAID